MDFIPLFVWCFRLRTKCAAIAGRIDVLTVTLSGSRQNFLSENSVIIIILL